MPLRKRTGIPIVPTPASAGLRLLAPGAEAKLDRHKTRILHITPSAQVEAEWCWAACVEMVLAFYKRPKQQCSIVGQKLVGQETACCENPDDPAFSTVSCDSGDM